MKRMWLNCLFQLQIYVYLFLFDSIISFYLGYSQYSLVYACFKMELKITIFCPKTKVVPPTRSLVLNNFSAWVAYSLVDGRLETASKLAKEYSSQNHNVFMFHLVSITGNIRYIYSECQIVLFKFSYKKLVAHMWEWNYTFRCLCKVFSEEVKFNLIIVGKEFSVPSKYKDRVLKTYSEQYLKKKVKIQSPYPSNITYDNRCGPMSSILQTMEILF